MLLSDDIGVFGESVSVSVKEGDSVTLHTDRTDLWKDVIEWRFGTTHVRIVRMSKGNTPTMYEYVLDSKFRGRLKLNSQTGDLTITNINTTDSGEYEVSNSISTFRKSFEATEVPGSKNPCASRQASTYSRESGVAGGTSVQVDKTSLIFLSS
ncbi:hypothetical protein H4Q32_023954 [Labeo rohita]|uniref:Immunoglobulin V-set domain-containing protein n=1 Tax=Labeo rohita TaxID=84645 RepID=A0ABQ8L9A0_LABRO|nr:hypothetical protein H4Q32_023954 [Labeo rohita]